MQEFMEGLSTYQQVLVFIALPSTLFFLISTAMTLFGFGAEEMDFDLDLGDAEIGTDIDHSDGDGGASYFSFKNVITFLTIFSWTSLSLIEANWPIVLNLVASFITGAIVIVLMNWLFTQMYRLKDEKSFEPESMLGRTTNVTLKVGANSIGKIQILYDDGGSTEYQARNSSSKDIPSGSTVIIEDYRNGEFIVSGLED